MLRLLERFRNPRAQLEKVLGTFELPVFPATAHRVLGALRAPGVNGREVADHLAQDPGLSVAVLRTVNSPAFRLPNRVESVGQAVTLLGFSAVESIVLSVAIAKTLPKPKCPGFDVERFWNASAARGSAARALAKRIHPQSANEAYTAALLQDMAIPLFADFRPEVYGPVLQQWHAGTEELTLLEQEALRVDHAEIASWMAHEWNLPESIVSAISEHHERCTEATLPAVSLVSSLREIDLKAGLDHLIARAESAFGLLADETRAIVEAACEQSGELAATF